MSHIDVKCTCKRNEKVVFFMSKSFEIRSSVIWQLNDIYKFIYILSVYSLVSTSVSHMGGLYIKTNSNFPHGWDIMKEPIWPFDVDYITQNISTYSC